MGAASLTAAITRACGAILCLEVLRALEADARRRRMDFMRRKPLDRKN